MILNYSASSCNIKLFSCTLLLALLLVWPLSATASYQELDWIELIPEDDLEALMNPPEWLDELEDDSLEGQLSMQMSMVMEQAHDSRYHEALVSTKTREEFDQRKVRIPGFIVPLEHNAKQEVTRFFLVPYFGACIHVPPPPPNQIIYGRHDAGIRQQNLYDPFWLEGTLETSLVENDMATSAYSMTVDRAYAYE